MTLHQQGAQLLTSQYLSECLMWVLAVAAGSPTRRTDTSTSNHWCPCARSIAAARYM